MRHSLVNLFSKRLSLPQLSPSHTSGRILKFLKKDDVYVESYDPLMIIECSKDLIADPAGRAHPDERLIMIIETCDEGYLKNMNDHNNEWIDIGTEIGTVYDGDPVDSEWIWQAYVYTDKHSS